MKNNCFLLELEDLDIYDYKILYSALRLCSDSLYLLEIEDDVYDELLSKLERNIDKVQYNDMIKEEKNL